VIGRWRKLHNEELYNLYAPLDICRMVDVMDRSCSTLGR